jgi:hypothetical protein
MRLTTWNCRVGAFRKKAAYAAILTPDVLVVPECEDLRQLLLLDGATQPTTRLWFSSRATSRGVGVFSYSGATISLAPLIGEPIDFFVPLLVQVKERDLQIVAVWTAETSSRKTRYRQAHEGLDRYAEWIAANDTVLMGDFNNNAGFGNGKFWADLANRVGPLEQEPTVRFRASRKGRTPSRRLHVRHPQSRGRRMVQAPGPPGPPTTTGGTSGPACHRSVSDIVRVPPVLDALEALECHGFTAHRTNDYRRSPASAVSAVKPNCR